MKDIIVRYADYPYGVRGFVMESPDGFINIYINSRYCHSQNIRTLLHELDHVRNGDLWSVLAAHQIERAVM